MATIRKRGAFQWEAQIRKKGFPEQSKTFNTRTEAEAWAAVIESEMVRGVFVSRAEAERTSLGQIIDRYIEEVSPTHRGGDSEALRLKAMRRHPLASRFLATLTSTDFAKYRDERRNGNPEKKIKPAKPATVHRELGLFQQVIDQARREWEIALPENPLRLVSRPRLQNARDRRLDASEEKYLIAALESGGRDESGKFVEGTRNPWVAPAVKLALETAMRQGELTSLTWANVDLAAATAYLPLTKNGEARTVPLSRAAVALLRALARSTVKLALETAMRKGGLVSNVDLDAVTAHLLHLLLTKNGEACTVPLSSRAAALLSDLPRSLDGRVFPITSNALKIAWQRAIRRAKADYERDCKVAGIAADPGLLADLRFHDLRHEATSRIAEKLSNILELAAVTGHKDLQMLKRYYHPRAEDLARKLG